MSELAQKASRQTLSCDCTGGSHAVVELGLRGESVAKACDRSEQRVRLEECVLALLGRLDRELEVDLVRAVGDPEAQPRSGWRAAKAPARGVLDETRT
jgi:hypothetical protein